MTSIYGLYDQTGTLRYIGKANDPYKRLSSHLRDSRRRNTPLYSWMRKCLTNGFIPVVGVLETCHADQWQEREREWISRARAIRPLLNLADGGDQPFCSKEVRAANGRKVAKLRVVTPEQRKLYRYKTILSQCLRQGYASDALKAKLRLQVVRYPQTFGCFAKWL